MELAQIALEQGDLHATLERAEELLAVSTDEQQVSNAAHFLRAWVRALRGQIDEALPESEKGLERSRRLADAQQLAPMLLLRAYVLLSAGKPGEANALLDECLAIEHLLTRSTNIDQLPLVLAELGRAADYANALATIPVTGAWIDAGLAVAAGDLARAAELYGTIGARFDQNWARLLAAERGDASGLDAARAYFAEQGTTPFLRRCQALLPASA
jgi:tetratricopeptide (TPR) repeat protein